jgi:hypothetical protein
METENAQAPARLLRGKNGFRRSQIDAVADHGTGLGIFACARHPRQPGGSLTEIESWRLLPGDRIEFTMRLANIFFDKFSSPSLHRYSLSGRRICL